MTLSLLNGCCDEFIFRMTLGLAEENNEAMTAGKVSKFRGNAVQFSRPFSLFRFELPFESHILFFCTSTYHGKAYDV